MDATLGKLSVKDSPRARDEQKEQREHERLSGCKHQSEDRRKAEGETQWHNLEKKKKKKRCWWRKTE